MDASLRGLKIFFLQSTDNLRFTLRWDIGVCSDYRYREKYKVFQNRTYAIAKRTQYKDYWDVQVRHKTGFLTLALGVTRRHIAAQNLTAAEVADFFAWTINKSAFQPGDVRVARSPSGSYRDHALFAQYIKNSALAAA